MYDRAYHEANRERINQKHRENYLKHREERNTHGGVQSISSNVRGSCRSKRRTVRHAHCAT